MQVPVVKFHNVTVEGEEAKAGNISSLGESYKSRNSFLRFYCKFRIKALQEKSAVKALECVEVRETPAKFQLKDFSCFIPIVPTVFLTN